MSSTVVLHVWHYYSTLLLFFYCLQPRLLPQIQLLLQLHLHTLHRHENTKTTIQPAFYSSPIFFIILSFCYYANVLAVSFFLFFSFEYSLCDCHYCFTLHRQHCHWFDSCFVYAHYVCVRALLCFFYSDGYCVGLTTTDWLFGTGRVRKRPDRLTHSFG